MTLRTRLVSAGPAQMGPPDPTAPRKYWRNEHYPIELWYFLLCFLGLLTLVNASRQLHNYIQRSRVTREASNRTSEMRRSKPPSFVLDALNRFRILVFRYTVPVNPWLRVNFSELSVSIGYLTLLLVWLFVNTRSDKTGGWLSATYWDNRAGALAASQLPLVVALAGKNNIISFLTGVSYEKLSIIHRAVARSIFVLVAIHFVGRCALGFTGLYSWQYAYVKLGMSCGALFALIIVLTLRPIRERFHNFFYYIHILLVLTLLIAVYFHIQMGVAALGYYVWPAILIWGLDRIFRLSRIIVLNRNSSSARVEILSEDTLRVTMSRPTTWRAGQCAYLTAPMISTLPFEAHPFTIAGISDSLSESEEEQVRDPSLKFIVRVREGFTKRLRDHARRNGSKDLSTIFIDGPYGFPPDLRVKDTVVLIAGGSGVSYTLALLLDLIRLSRSSNALCRRIVFVWSMRHPEHINWIIDDLTTALRMKPDHLFLDIRVHVSNPKARTFLEEVPVDEEGKPESSKHCDVSDIEKGSDVTRSAVTECHPGIVQLPGRPDIDSYIRGAIKEAAGPVSINVSGPQSLSTQVNSILSKPAVLQNVDVSLHIERFGM